MSDYDGDLASYSGGGDEELRWKVQCKVDKTTDDLLDEISMHLTAGNRSALLRRIIGDWFEQVFPSQSKNSKRPMPAKLRFYLQKRKQRDRQETERELRRTAVDLRLHPDGEMEAAAAALAAEYGLPWPPQDIKEAEVDPDLVRVLARVRDLSRNNGDGCSLRDIQRALGDAYTASELRSHLGRLAELEEVKLEGNISSNGKVKVLFPF